MSSHTQPHNQSTYRTIFAVLLALTVLTVLVSRAHFGFMAGLAIAGLVAAVKGSLVAFHFMHLKFESRHLTAALLVPVVLAVILILGLLPDMLFGRM